MIYEVESFLELHQQLLEKGLYHPIRMSEGKNEKCGLCAIEYRMKGVRIELGFHIRRMGLRPVTSVDIYDMFVNGFDISNISSDLAQLGIDGVNTTYWGSESNDPNLGIYTPLRQNIVLLLAALNDEL